MKRPLFILSLAVLFMGCGSEIVNVQLNETGAAVELINIIGSTVISSVATELNTQLDVSGLNAGSYLVRVTQKGEVRTKAIQIIK